MSYFNKSEKILTRVAPTNLFNRREILFLNYGNGNIFHYLQSIKFWTNFIYNFPDGLEIEIWWSGAVEYKTDFD